MVAYFKKNKWAAVVLAVVFVLNVFFIYKCSVVYYRQMVQYNGLYSSDFPAHIESGRQATGYSISEAVLGILANTGISYKILGILMAMVSWATYYVSYKLMKLVAKDADPVLLYAGVLICNVVTAYYIPQLNPYRYLGVQSGNIYHNSTYITMKFFGTAVLFLYFKYLDVYEKGLSKEQWILFCESIILVNLSKPNFITGFAPVMGIWLLIDLIRKKGKTFPQIFMFGLAVIPSVLVLAFEYMSLFPSGGDRGGLELTLGYALKLRTEHPTMAVIQTLAFPFFVLIFHLKDLIKERKFAISWAFLVTNFMVYFFVAETGVRRRDGNLSWGYCYAIYTTFLVATAKFVEDITAKEKRKPLVYFIVGGLLLAGHVFFGIQYFSIILAGKGFF